MVRMVTRLHIVLSCLLVASLGGCGGGSQATSPPDAPTVTGGVVGSAGTGGGPGGIGGGSGGTGGQLSTTPPLCIPGASVACACVTGQTGAQTCTSAGTFAACVCATTSLDAGGTGGTGGTTVPLSSSGTGGQVTSVQDGATPDLTESAPDLALSSQTADAPPSLPDASAAMDAEPLAPLQECTAEQKVSLTYAEASGIVNGVASPATNRFWPGPLVLAVSNQCIFNCVVDGGVFSDAGPWTACIAIETVANVRSGLVCVARASDCDLCTGQLVR